MIFCNDLNKKEYYAFNKEVGKERYNEIRDLIINDILKGLELELNKNPWTEEWKKVSKEQWLRMKNEILEFDEKIVENIIGFELDLEDEMIEIDGKKVSKSTIKEALKKHLE